jgi:RHS repeat-associated protein
MSIHQARPARLPTCQRTNLEHRAIADVNGNTEWQLPYQGNPWSEVDPTSNGYTYNFRQPGFYYDQETGQMNWGFRTYNSGTGRSLQSDPIGLFGGQWSTYVYVDNNPLIYIDPSGLSTLVFDRSSGTITILDKDGNVVDIQPAANNAQSGSRGPWADGTYNFDHNTTHLDGGPNSAYGSNGNTVFNVPGCVGCGVHSGRATVPDRAGRVGVQHATNGCIRTTDTATSDIRRLQSNGDPVTTLTEEH